MAEIKQTQIATNVRTIMTSLGNSPREVYTQNAGDYTPLKIKAVYVGDPSLNNKKPIQIWPPEQNIIICQYALLWETDAIMRITNVVTKDLSNSGISSASGLASSYIKEYGSNIQLDLTTGSTTNGTTIRVSPVPSLQGSYIDNTLNVINAYNSNDRETMLSFTSSSDMTFIIPDERSGYTNDLQVTIPNSAGLKTHINYRTDIEYTHVLLVTIAPTQLSQELYRTVVVNSSYKSSQYGWIPLNVNSTQQGCYKSGEKNGVDINTIATNIKLSNIYKLTAFGNAVTTPGTLGVNSAYDGRFMFMVSTDGTTFNFIQTDPQYISSTGSNVLNSSICTNGKITATIDAVKGAQSGFSRTGISVIFNA